MQGKVATLGVLRTSRDWFNSLLVISLAAAGLGCFLVVTSFTSSRALTKRTKAAKDFGIDED